MSKRVLVLTDIYYPNPSPNGICINNIAKNMQKKNAQVTCICYDDKNSCEYNDVNVYKVSKGLLHSINFALEKRTGKVMKLFKRGISWLVKIRQYPFLLCWPWTDPIFTHKVYQLAEKLYKANPFDAVIAVHMPLSSIIVGHKLKEKHPKIKFYPYFLDSLSAGRPIRIRSDEWNRNKKLKWEHKLLGNAEKIVAMESSRSHHEKYNADMEFYKNMIFLDIPLFSLPEKEARVGKNPFHSKKINVVFCGTANYPMRNLEYFFDLVSAIETDNIQFTLIGDSNYKPLLSNQHPGIQHVPHVPRNDLDHYYAWADVLLNFGVTTPAAISGKIFEYISYGKPIISTYSINDEACIPYLTKYPISLLLDERDTDMRLQASRLVTFIEDTKGKTVSYDEVAHIFYDNTPQAFVERVLEGIDEK